MFRSFFLALVVLAMALPVGAQDYVWGQRFGDNSTGGQFSESVATDGLRNVIVTGEFEGSIDFGGGILTSAGAYDIFLAKFNANGNHVWSKRLGGLSDQYQSSVAVDGSGNILVTGEFARTIDFGGASLTSAGDFDIFVVKFSASGTYLWSKRFGDAYEQTPFGIALDNAGNILVTGRFDGTVDFGGGGLVSSGYYDIFLAKFSANGNHLWSKRFGNIDSAIGESVAVDNLGNIVVTGGFLGTINFGGSDLVSAGGADIFLAKFNANGNHLWSKRFGGLLDQYNNNVAVDGAGNILVSAGFVGTINFGGGNLVSVGSTDIFLAKFNANGNHLWSKRFGDESDQYSSDVIVDGSGNVFITGQLGGNVDFGGGVPSGDFYHDFFLAGFNQSGSYLWERQAGDVNSQWGESVAVDGEGNILVTGTFEGTMDFGGGPLTSAGDVDVFLAKFSNDGATGIGDESIVDPSVFTVSCYPNPFNPTTSIRYTLPEAAHVRLDVYDITGRHLTTLVDRTEDIGEHVVRWDATGLASGVYFYRLSAGSDTATRKMVLLR